jgi:cell division protein FtsZ
VLLSGVQGITDLITTPGLINLDFADVKSVMSGAGSALMGIGSSRGDDRAVAAAEMAISSPLLEASIDGAHGVLLSIQGGSDLGLFEINAAAQLVSNSAAVDANIIFGAVIDDALGDEVRVTVIAAGFDEALPGSGGLSASSTTSISTSIATSSHPGGMARLAGSAAPRVGDSAGAPDVMWSPASGAGPAAASQGTAPAVNSASAADSYQILSAPVAESAPLAESVPVTPVTPVTGIVPIVEPAPVVQAAPESAPAVAIVPPSPADQSPQAEPPADVTPAVLSAPVSPASGPSAASPGTGRLSHTESASKTFEVATTRRRPVVFEEDDDLDIPDFLK